VTQHVGGMGDGKTFGGAADGAAVGAVDVDEE
jgi:hypothetical protein